MLRTSAAAVFAAGDAVDFYDPVFARRRANERDAIGGGTHPLSFILDAITVQTVLVLQGGGALGAFEAGVVKALESENIFPDVVAGVSIGALNGAIVAANPRHATEALESFWRELTVTPRPSRSKTSDVPP
jgi:predicted acylesterase/phospholipase RssA